MVLCIDFKEKGGLKKKKGLLFIFDGQISVL